MGVHYLADIHCVQFVDALVLQRTLKQEANRRVSLLIAQKSVHGFIGWGSRQTGSVPVGRAQDKAKPAKGTIYLPDPLDKPTLVRGIDSDFESEAEVGGMIFLPSVKGQAGSSVEIAKIVGPREILVKRPLKSKVPMQQLTGRDDIDDEGNMTNKAVKGPREGYGGTKYKLAPKTDQTEVYRAVFDRLRNGGCVGIFPEGGSHDRTELLPLKAGVAIMALGTLAEDPDCGLQIVPVGMNYFHAHKFRSRAVVEFGAPFELPRELIDKYKNNQRREAIGATLDMCHQALGAVTTSAPDYDTLMCIQAARRLYVTGKKVPLPIVVELNRRLAVGFSKFKEDPRIIDVMDKVRAYDKQLRYLNIRDHQLGYAKMTWPAVVFTLFYRVAKLLVLSIGVVPGTVLFSPVFITAKSISRSKAREALAGSSVKIQGRDVMATWKLMVALAVAPILYNFYSLVLVLYVRQYGLWGSYSREWTTYFLIFLAGWIIFPAITFASFRFGEVGMDIVKSLRPLVLCINPSSGYSIQRLRERREELAEQVVTTINDLGPDMYDDFDRTRLITNPEADGFLSGVSEVGRPRGESEPETPTSPGAAGDDGQGLMRRNTTSSRAIPRSESFSNIAHIGMFSTRPPSRQSRSRTSSSGGGAGGGSAFGGGGGFMAGFPVAGFTALDSSEGFNEASNKIRQAMAERGQLRRRKSGTSGFTTSSQLSDDAGSEDGDSVHGGAGEGSAPSHTRTSSSLEEATGSSEEASYEEAKKAA